MSCILNCFVNPFFRIVTALRVLLEGDGNVVKVGEEAKEGNVMDDSEVVIALTVLTQLGGKHLIRILASIAHVWTLIFYVAENIWHILEGWVNTFFEIGTALTPLIEDDDEPVGEVAEEAKESDATAGDSSEPSSPEEADAKSAVVGDNEDDSGSAESEATPACRFVRALRVRFDF